MSSNIFHFNHSSRNWMFISKKCFLFTSFCFLLLEFNSLAAVDAADTDSNLKDHETIEKAMMDAHRNATKNVDAKIWLIILVIAVAVFIPLIICSVIVVSLRLNYNSYAVLFPFSSFWSRVAKEAPRKRGPNGTMKKG